MTAGFLLEWMTHSLKQGLQEELLVGEEKRSHRNCSVATSNGKMSNQNKIMGSHSVAEAGSGELEPW